MGYFLAFWIFCPLFSTLGMVRSAWTDLRVKDTLLFSLAPPPNVPFSEMVLWSLQHAFLPSLFWPDAGETASDFYPERTFFSPITSKDLCYDPPSFFRGVSPRLARKGREGRAPPFFFFLMLNSPFPPSPPGAMRRRAFFQRLFSFFCPLRRAAGLGFYSYGTTPPSPVSGGRSSPQDRLEPSCSFLSFPRDVGG